MGNFLFSQTSEQSKNSALYLLSTISKKDTSITQIIEDFKPEWVDSLKLILPCEGVMVPKRSMRLPNAPRDYRNGIHRGIDFFANWGYSRKSCCGWYCRSVGYLL